MFGAYVFGHPYFGQAPNIDPDDVAQPPVGDGGADATWTVRARAQWSVDKQRQWTVRNPRIWTRLQNVA